MDQYRANLDPAQPKQISVIDIFIKALFIARYIKAKWALLLASTILGALFGLTFSMLIKPQYTAVCTFVLEEGDKEGMLAQYSGLASLAGIDLGNSGGGIFKGDNIIELYRSRTMLKKTLLTEIVYQGQKQKLIDRYIAFNDLRSKWEDVPALRSINFSGNTTDLDRSQDSIVFDIVESLNKHNLDVSKPDKKLSIVKVAFTAKDEFFAKNFTDKLVANVNDFYIQTKTKKLSENVRLLEHQSDSVRKALNNSINGVAIATESAPLANPILTTLRSSSQKRQVDVQAGGGIYGELVKNLEMARLSLRQQTPLIQFIDQPELPLYIDHMGKVKGMLIGAAIALFVTICSLLMLRLLMTLRTAVNNKLDL